MAKKTDWLDELMSGNVKDIEIPKDLGSVTRLAGQLVKATERVKRIEAQLATAKEVMDKVAKETLPDAFKALKIKTLGFEGHTLELKDWVSASIPVEHKAAAHAWLRAEEYDDILKNIWTASFARGKDEQFKAFQDYASKWNGYAQGGVTVETATGVHPQTLVKFVKERMAEGVALPVELFNVNTGSLVRIKENK